MSWDQIQKEETTQPIQTFSVSEWLKESDKAQRVVCLIYGTDGTGKTGIAMDYPLKEGEKAIFLDLDGGAAPLKEEFHSNKQIIVRNPTVLREDGGIDYEATLKRIMQVVAWVKANAQQHNIKLFVLDGVSTLLKFCEYTMRLRVDKDIGEGIEMRFWQIRSKLFTEVITAIKSLPTDVIFIAHEDFIVGDEGGSAVKVRLNQMAFQKIRCEKLVGLNGEVKYIATIDKSKYYALAEGKKITILEIKNGSVEWRGEKVWEVLGVKQ